MFIEYEAQPNPALFLIVLVIAVTIGTSAGCTQSAPSGSTAPKVYETLPLTLTVTPGVIAPEAAEESLSTPVKMTTAAPSATAQTPWLPATATLTVTPQPSHTPLPTPTPSRVVTPTVAHEATDFRALLPAVPPGFGKLADHLLFFSNRSGNYQLYQIALDGSDLVALTQDAAYDVYDMEPAWSTDGKIAFTSDHLTGWWEVFVLYPDEGPPVQVTYADADAWSLAWSPDGRSLAFVSNATGDDEIYLVHLDGAAPVNLTQRPDAEDFLPVWSPNGQQLAFVSDQEAGQDIFVMAADGSSVTRLTDAEGRDTSPSWSPDGTEIAFVTERDGNFEVYVMNADGSDPMRLTSGDAYEWSPTWSPDGRLIAFTSTRDHHDTYDLYVMAPDGSDQIRLTSNAANDIIPRWWP